ncbi:MAG: HDOD domain-containing protein [Planctomycetaceae bacterium]
MEVLRLFDDPDSSIDQIASVIRKDPAISTRLLKAANSSQYGNMGDVSDVVSATTLLGGTVLFPLVLSFSLLDSQSSPVNMRHTSNSSGLRSFKFRRRHRKCWGVILDRRNSNRNATQRVCYPRW